MGRSAVNWIWTKTRRPGDDTRCLSIALGWMRWLLVVGLFVIGDSPETSLHQAAVEMSSIPGYEALLSAAQLAVPPDRVGSLPWETNQFLAEVFGEPVQLEPEFKRPRIVHDFIPSVASA